LLENNNDTQSQRNQLIAIVIMTVLVVVWTYFFIPRPEPVEPAPPGTQTAGETAPEDAVPETPPGEPGGDAAPETPPGEPGGDAAPETPPAGEEAVMAALPPESLTPEEADDHVTLSKGPADAIFTRIGARLKKAVVYLDSDRRETRQLIPDWGEVPDAEAVYPLGLRFADDFLGDELDRRRWELVPDTPAGMLVFRITVPGVLRVEKRFQFADEDFVLKTSVTCTNLMEENQVIGKLGVSPAWSLNWGPNVNSGDAHKFMKQTIVWTTEAGMHQEPTASLELPRGRRWSLRLEDPAWAAIRSCYFVIALKPDFENAQGWVTGVPEHFRMGISAPRTELAAGESFTRDFRIYMGPRLNQALEQAWPGLDRLMEIFTVWGFTPVAAFMNKFSILLLEIMNWFYRNVIGNYGFAIIFVTLLVRMGMFPLTLKSMKSMKRMQMLAPEIEKIKAEIGEDNQQELQKRMMELYRERGVSPLGGCFPLMLQMPVFIAFYRMLSNAYELRNAPFLFWIRDLSEPDALFQLPFSIPIPFAGSGIDAFNLLPLLMGGAMVLSQKLMPTSGPVQNQQQKIMMTIMPVFFCVICYNMASSLNLYILTSTLLGIAQNYLVRQSDVDVEPVKKKKKPNRSRHFYTAAQSRKREVAKESRREKKQQQRRVKKNPSDKSGKKRP
jgi:YidC/Oxa1 family membrane protein insertase